MNNFLLLVNKLQFYNKKNKINKVDSYDQSTNCDRLKEYKM